MSDYIYGFREYDSIVRKYVSNGYATLKPVNKIIIVFESPNDEEIYSKYLPVNVECVPVELCNYETRDKTYELGKIDSDNNYNPNNAAEYVINTVKGANNDDGIFKAIGIVDYDYGNHERSINIVNKLKKCFIAATECHDLETTLLFAYLGKLFRSGKIKEPKVWADSLKRTLKNCVIQSALWNRLNEGGYSEKAKKILFANFKPNKKEFFRPIVNEFEEYILQNRAIFDDDFLASSKQIINHYTKEFAKKNSKKAFDSWLAGECTEEEQNIIKEWLKLANGHILLFNFLCNDKNNNQRFLAACNYYYSENDNYMWYIAESKMRELLLKYRGDEPDAFMDIDPINSCVAFLNS